MFSTPLIVISLSDTEMVQFNSKSLLVRWVIGTANDKMMAFKCWNDLTSHAKLAQGSELLVEFRIESRENKGRYFTDLTITKID